MTRRQADVLTRRLQQGVWACVHNRSKFAYASARTAFGRVLRQPQPSRTTNITGRASACFQLLPRMRNAGALPTIPIPVTGYRAPIAPRISDAEQVGRPTLRFEERQLAVSLLIGAQSSISSENLPLVAGPITLRYVVANEVEPEAARDRPAVAWATIAWTIRSISWKGCGN